MKLVIAIIQAYDSDRLLQAATSAGLRATKVVSLGGFLRMANATIFMGVEDDRVAQCLETIRANCESRVESSVDATQQDFFEWFPIGVQDVTVGGAVVFIVPVDRYLQMMPDGTQRTRLAE